MSYFVQITDAHMAPMDREENVTFDGGRPSRGDSIINPEGRHYPFTQTPVHLAETVREIRCLGPQPAFVLMTGDQATCGTRAELERYLRIVEPLSMPKYYSASNHDLHGEPEAFRELIGERRARFDHEGLRFFVMDEYSQSAGDKSFSSWRALARKEHYDWLADGLSEWDGQAVLVTHLPILPLGEGRYADAWDTDETQRFVDFLAGTSIRWHITGHWHRNMRWQLGKMTAINTGALAGFQCSGPEPFFLMSVRPGYRIFHWDGEVLRSHWHNLRAWMEAEIVSVGAAHLGGPRPQVCPAVVSRPATIHVQAYAPGRSIESVEWGLAREVTVERHKARPVMTVPGWRPMTRRWKGLWSAWEAELDGTEYKPGRYVMLTRAMRKGDSQWGGHDAVPIGITHNVEDPPVRSEFERLFALFDFPTEP